MPRRNVRWRFDKGELVSWSKKPGDDEVCCSTGGPKVQEETDAKETACRSRQTALPGPEAGKHPLLLPDQAEVGLNLSNQPLTLQGCEDVFSATK